jgi:hypothetical protein
MALHASIIERLMPTLREVIFDFVGEFRALVRVRRCSRSLDRQLDPAAATRIWHRARPPNLADALAHPTISLWTLRRLHAIYGFTHEDARAHHNLAFLVACTDGRFDLVQWLATTFRLTRDDIYYATGRCPKDCELHSTPTEDAADVDAADSKGPDHDDGHEADDKSWKRVRFHISADEREIAPDLVELQNAAELGYANYKRAGAVRLTAPSSQGPRAGRLIRLTLLADAAADAKRAHDMLARRLRQLREPSTQVRTVGAALQRLKQLETQNLDRTLLEYMPSQQVADLIDRAQTSVRSEDQPLIAACANGHYPIVKWICKRTQPNPMWGDAMAAACRNGHLQTARGLLKRAKLSNVGRENIRRALLGACRHGHPSVVAWLARYAHRHHCYLDLAFKQLCTASTNDSATLETLATLYGPTIADPDTTSKWRGQAPLGALPPEAVAHRLRVPGRRPE